MQSRVIDRVTRTAPPRTSSRCNAAREVAFSRCHLHVFPRPAARDTKSTGGPIENILIAEQSSCLMEWLERSACHTQISNPTIIERDEHSISIICNPCPRYVGWLKRPVVMWRVIRILISYFCKSRAVSPGRTELERFVRGVSYKMGRVFIIPT